MDEYYNKTPDREDIPDGKNPSEIDEISLIREDVSYLRDLFVRRLKDDKQKNFVIQKLAEGATYAFIEPFLYDLILLLDRLERSEVDFVRSEDDFIKSVREELYDILSRRGVEKIKVTSKFDPTYYKAVKVSEDPSANALYVAGVIRNGYLFSGKVIRPAEVEVIKPTEKCVENPDED